VPPATTRSVQVVAHRGSSGEHAEHTLAAYEKALAQGADALECDVRLTRDGVLVCVHDRRIDRTSDGRGVVSTLELADLADLDFASWKQRQRDPLLEAAWDEADLDPERRSVLTLERLLQLVLDHDRRVQLQVETKHPTRYGGRVERRLVEVLDRYGLASPLSRSVSRVAVLSYSPSSLRRVHVLAPAIPTVLNMDRVPVRYRDGSLPPQVQAAGVAVRVVRLHPRYVERAHSQGNRVHVFTADDPADIDYLLDLGVDAIVSNHPRRVLRRLGRA
jgi:glycerophosphoryl diester phosphodiesterase